MKFGRKLIYLVIIALSFTNVSVATIGADFRIMLFWPILAIAILANLKFSRSNEPPPKSLLFFGGFLMMAMSLAVNLDSNAITTAIFTLAWIAYWIWLILVRRAIEPVSVRRTLEWVILIYFFIILASVASALIGVSEPPIPELMGWTNDSSGILPRFFGPTTEPSYAALILGASWLGIRRLPARDDKNAKFRKRLVLVAVFGSLLALQSIYGFLVAILLASTMLTGYTARAQRIWLVSLAVLAMPFLLALVPSSTRLGRVLEVLPTMDLTKLQLVDNSAYMRIGPFYDMMSNASPLSIPFWLGNGAGVAEMYFSNLMGFVSGGTLMILNLGFFPAFVYDFGALPAAIIVIYLMLICAGPFSTQSRALIILALFNCNFNTHLFWFIATCMFLSMPIVKAQVRRAVQKLPKYHGEPMTSAAWRR